MGALAFTQLSLWTTGTWKVTPKGSLGNVTAMTLSPDAKLLACEDVHDLIGKSPIEIYSLADVKRVATIEAGRPAYWLPDSKTVVTGGNKVRFWDARTGKLVKEWDDSAGGFNLSRDGKTAVVAGQVREAATGKVLRDLEGKPAAVYLSPDGKRAVGVGSDGRLWDVTTGKQTGTVEGLRNTRYGNSRTDPWFSDSRTLALSSLPTGMQIVDATTGRICARLGREEDHAVALRLPSGLVDVSLRRVPAVDDPVRRRTPRTPSPA